MVGGTTAGGTAVVALGTFEDVLLVGGSGGQCSVGIAVSSSTSRLAALAAITAFCIISRILILRLLADVGLEPAAAPPEKQAWMINVSVYLEFN